MVLKLDGNTFYTYEGKQVFAKKKLIFYCSVSNQMPHADQFNNFTCSPISE